VKLKNVDGELYVDTPTKPIMVLFKNQSITNEEDYDIIRLDIERKTK